MRAILWDLDDTLLDTIEERMRALAHAYEKCTARKTDPFVLWRSHQGGTLEDLGRALLGTRYREFLEAFDESFSRLDRQPRPYRGISDAVVRLSNAGLLQAVVTSRGSWTATEDLLACGLAVAATWGTMDKPALLDAAPDIEAEAPAEILDLLERVAPA